MVFLEDQHWSQPNGVGTASTDVDANRLGLLQELVPVRGIPSDECALSFTTQVLNIVGILFGKALERAVEVVTGDRGVLHQLLALNFFVNGAEENSTSRVTHPGVELTVWLVGAQGRVAVVVTGGLSFLGERHQVRRRVQVPVVMSPEFSGGSDTGLHLINDEKNLVALGDVAEPLEESGRRMVITTLGLDGLHDDSGNGIVEFLDQALRLLEAALLLLRILFSVFLQGILEGRERSLGPVEGRDVQFVNGLATGGRQTAKETTVEGRLERQDRQLRRTRALVEHGRRCVFLGELYLGTTTLLLTVVHERGFVCSFVRIRASESSEDLIQALGSGLQKTGLQDVRPVGRRKISESRPIDHGPDHLRRLDTFCEVGIVVSHGDGSNLGITTET